jgi:hypothetical protein
MAKKKRTTLSANVSGDPIQAYLDAQQNLREVDRQSSWDIIGDAVSDVTSGIAETNMAIQQEKAQKQRDRQLLLEQYEQQFQNNVDLITQNAGSLGEEYFDVASNEAKKMQLEYAEAVKAGDKELQSKLKMRLQGLATGTGAMKEILSDLAESQNNGDLSNGRTEEEKQILAVCTDPTNIVHMDGEWKWKNPEYDGSEGSKEFYTQKDLDGAFVEMDYKTSAAYNEFESDFNALGSNYVNQGAGGSFEKDRMKIKIQDSFITEDNIMSVMHDDFRGEGDSKTFVREVSDYMNATPDFYKQMGIDVNLDGVVDYKDYDSDEDKEILIRAIVDKTSPHYKYDISKDILSDWLASKCEQQFYGDSDPNLKPEPGQTLEEFVNAGGVAGLHMGGNSNYTYSEQYGFRLKENLTAEEILEKSKD